MPLAKTGESDNHYQPVPGERWGPGIVAGKKENSMQFQICLCGAQQGQSHKEDCPRVVYRGSSTTCERWEAERERKRAAMAGVAPDEKREWRVVWDAWGECHVRYF